ncbi:hypothetical protein A3H26_00120 [candidate division WWE3 bacterium RIFCSPLOWO2_12_FULL_36_10]|uniref:Uncharacterized protein n=1 Tax=candidate division WWE3 bacterium RIFCSPLOWO2_12_FULL_36_10 TaxID=1802630 RepID=A0A1F4VIX8_UNCKA|nr:MAG: hypothetical protein A3H26_00120 [candidate division WWE3 bacterium RIFCSPLOWO2_12_FULL_36_10]
MAVTIPKKAGVKTGSMFEFSQEGNNLIYRPLGTKSPTLKETHIEETSGAIDLDLNSRSLNKIIRELKENPYEREISLL